MIMIPLAIALDRPVQSSMMWLFFASLGAYLVLHYLFRHLREGLLGVARSGVALFGAATVYFCGISFILPCVPVLSSFDRPDSLADVKDPKKLLDLLQAQHSALVDSITIADRTAHALFLVSLMLLIHGCTFLHRMREAQREHLRFGHPPADSGTPPQT